MKALLYTLCLLCFSLAAKAQSPTIYLDSQLVHATYIGEVEIVRTDSGYIYYKALDRPSIVQKVKSKCMKVKPGQLGDNLSGTCPNAGDYVLLVINHDHLSLCASKDGSTYRFWSPDAGMGMTIFMFRKPAAPLEHTRLQCTPRKGSTYECCFDGCLLPVQELDKYRK